MNAPDVQDLVSSGALFAVAHSGGKDSQATLIEVARRVPREQIVVVHASLGAAEWPGALEHARRQADALGVPFLVARNTGLAAFHNPANPFLGLVSYRAGAYPDAPSFPQAANRQCTSDLKRGPMVREVRRYARARDVHTVVTCMGMRAAESAKRERMAVWSLSEVRPERVSRAKKGKNAGRVLRPAWHWWEWLPIHHFSTDEVFETIRAAGQEPHPAYAAGNHRLSCVFCIMASRNDLRLGALAHPELYREYVEMERRTGYTLHQSRKTLVELTGVPA